MLMNLFFSVAFFCLCAFAVVPEIPIRQRLLFIFLSLFLSVFSYAISFLNGKRPLLFSWISSKKVSVPAIYAGFIVFCIALALYSLSPSRGIHARAVSLLGEERSFSLDLPSLEILPVHFLDPSSFSEKGILHFRASFRLKESIPSLLIFVSHGEAEWSLDGKPLTRFEQQDASRFKLLVNEVQSGTHFLQWSLSHCSPFPHISVSSGEEKPIEGPFYDFSSLQPPAFPFFYRKISALFFLLAYLFFLPFFNLGLEKMGLFLVRYRKISLFLGFSLGLFLLIFIRFHFSNNTERYFEADESAFGLMSERLLLGQSPPLFHYEQNYQGTLESFPLALSLFFSTNPVMGLHLIPLFWGIFFILIITFTYWRFGSPSLALFGFIFLSLGGLHFHWILSKTWFGYSFSLFSGAILWWIALHSYQKECLSPFWAISWGIVAGMSFYQLPISIPFLLVSGILLLKHFFVRFIRGLDDPNRILSWSNTLIYSIYRSGLLLLFPFFLLFSFPYWADSFLSEESGAMQFMTKGRDLAPPRILDENPLVDRFFGECLPVFLGVRAPYDQQNDLSTALFPYFPTLLFFISLLSFPFVSKISLRSCSLFSHLLIRASFFLFSVFCVLIVTYSSFGIWPWYAIPLYWILPILFFVLLRFLWRISPALSITSMTFYFLSVGSAFFCYSSFFHQPSSLSNQGLWLPTNYDKIKTVLDERNIRYVLCDQGYDFSKNIVGRDWIGETLMFGDRSKYVTVDRLSRRVPDSSQELIKSSRIGYLFHQDYFYNDPVPMKTESDYSLVSLDHFSELFGNNFLHYERIDVDPYVLFLPRKYHPGFDKNHWQIDSTNPIYLLAAADQNISLRSSGRDTYWSSDVIKENGCHFITRFSTPQKIQTIVLFHGSKTADRTKENRVLITLEDGLSYNAGSLQYNPKILSSVLRLFKPMIVQKIDILVYPTEDKSWWTIYEMWAY